MRQRLFGLLVVIGAFFATLPAQAQLASKAIPGGKVETADVVTKPTTAAKNTHLDEFITGRRHSGFAPGIKLLGVEKPGTSAPRYHAGPVMGAASGAQIYAGRYWYYDEDPLTDCGLYGIPTASTDPTVVMKNENFRPNNGGVLIDGYYYCLYLDEEDGGVTTYVFDASNWQQVGEFYNRSIAYSGLDITYDPTTGNVYGCFYSADGDGDFTGRYEFGTIELSPTAAPVRNVIRENVSPLNAIACDNNGNLYGVVNRTGEFVKIDKVTGEYTVVGDTGLKPFNISTAAFDLADGTLYYAACLDGESSTLYTVDLTSGSLTRLAEFADNMQLVGMFIQGGTTPGTPDVPVSAAKLRGGRYWIWDEEPLSVNGVFDVPTDGSQPTMATQADNMHPNNGGVLVGNYYYAICSDEENGGCNTYVFDTTNGWQQVNEFYNRDFAYAATDLTYDPTTGNVYGCFYMSDSDGDFTGKYSFGTIEFSPSAAPVRHTIAENITWLNSIACDAQGNLYGTTGRSRELVKIDKTTGEQTVVGSLGIGLNMTASAAFADNDLYLAANCGLYKVDTTTGAATQLGGEYADDFQVTGLYAEAAGTQDPEPVVETLIQGGRYWIWDEEPLSVNGVFDVPADGSQPTMATQADNMHPNNGGVLVGNYYYAICSDEENGGCNTYVFDTTNGWQQVNEFYNRDFAYAATDLTYDPTTGNVYGCFYMSDSDGDFTGKYSFGTIEFSPAMAPVRHTIAENITWLNSIACDAQGNLYGTTGRSRELVKINKTTGEQTVVGSLGISLNMTASAAFDMAKDVLYLAANCGLYTVDTATGAATQLGSEYADDFQVTGMFIENIVPAPEVSVELFAGRYWVWDEEPLSMNGVFTVAADGSQPAMATQVNNMHPNNGGVLVGNYYYAICSDEENGGCNTYVFDTTNGWQQVNEFYNRDFAYAATDLTYDPTTGNVYGCFYMSDSDGDFTGKYSFGTIELSPALAPVRHTIAENITWLNSIACDDKGNLYGTTGRSHELVKIDKATGDQTVVGDLGMSLNMTATATFAGDKLYLGANYGLYTVDTDNGAATLVAEYADDFQLTGLFAKTAAAAEPQLAPAAATNLRVQFEGLSLNGVVTFDAPDTFVDGSAASGPLSYVVQANGMEVANGTTEFGAKDVTADVTLSVAGNYAFRVMVSNTVGTSEPTSLVRLYVGNDTPQPVSNVVLKRNGNTLNCSWNAVEGTVNGGIFDPALLSYKAVLKINGVDSAEGTYTGTATSCTFDTGDVTEFTRYEYVVTAIYGDAVSQPAYSNPVMGGCIIPPFEETFDTGLGDFFPIDVNADGTTWRWYNTVEFGGVAEIISSETAPKNDWLMSPPIYLEAGKYYEFSFMFHKPGANYPERFGVYMGTQPEVSAMTTTIFPAKVYDEQVHVDFQKGLTVTSSGIYYFGFFANSDADMNAIYIDNVKLSAGSSTDAPDAVSALSVTAGANGALTATVSFTTPTLTINGNILTSIDKVEVYRGETLVDTIENPAPGSNCSVTDSNVPADGSYKYSVMAYNAAGAGPVTEAEVYIGINLPTAPANAMFTETTAGTVEITWDAVNADIDGKALSASDVTYKVMYGTEVIASDLTDTKLTYTVVSPSQMAFAQFAVFAMTRGGESTEPAYTGFAPVGASYSMPFEADLTPTSSGGLSQYWGVDETNIFGILYCQVSVYSVNDIGGINFDANGDNYLWAINGNTPGMNATLFSSKIHVDQDAKNPYLVLYMFGIANNDQNTLEISLNGEVAQTVECKNLNAGGWNRILVPVDSYRGKEIAFALKGAINNYSFILFDGLAVIDVPEHDVAVSLSAPEEVAADSEFILSSVVMNRGLNAENGVSFSLYHNNELVDNGTLSQLSQGIVGLLSFKTKLPVVADLENTYRVELALDGDVNPGNNKSDDVTVMLTLPSYPVVELTGTVADGGAPSLSWTEPDLTGTPELPITENFEAYTAFTNSDFGGWTFVDLDDTPMGSAEGTTFPGMTPGEDKSSFFLLNNFNLNDSWAAHSGEQYLVSIFNVGGPDVPSDDWAISPELSGVAQTITFWAKSYSSAYPEVLEVLCSSTGVETSSFTSLMEVNGVPAQWTKYTVELPAGTKHFALRSKAEDAFMLFIDDVTFIPAQSPWTDLVIKGYNVYRDNVEIATVTTREYVDTEAVDGDHNYLVTVSYDRGESAPSNVVTLLSSGLSVVKTGNPAVSVDGRNIIVTGAEGAKVTVSTVDGRMLFTGIGKATTVVNAPLQGVYMVRAGATTAKVLVK